MKSSVFVFGTDFLHEGYDTVLDNLQSRAGVDAVTFSATYHDARDVFPHNPRYRVYRNEGDVAWFAPGDGYSGLAPRMAPSAGGEDVLAQLCALARRRGMAVNAWTIFLHNSVLATAFPDCATRNVYGDPYLTDLCPANPRVRAYCRELAADVGRYPVHQLMAESLHYRPLEHGEHHERYLIDIPPKARQMMSLCFCPHCRAAGKEAGIAMEDLAGAVRVALEPVWNGEITSGKPEPLLREDAQAALAAYGKVRDGVIASLVAEVREALAPSGVELCFIDHGGAMAHVFHGTGADDDVLRSSRRLGIDPVSIAANCDSYCALGYVDTPERLERHLARYRGVLGVEARLSVALRPLLPDCRAEENLAAKLAAVRAAGAEAVSFYHYAMMPLNRLDWIRHALKGGHADAKGGKA